MRETLPDIAMDDRMPMLFLSGFGFILLAMVAILVAVAILRERTRRAGIYRKYVTSGDDPRRRRVSRAT